MKNPPTIFDVIESGSFFSAEESIELDIKLSKSQANEVPVRQIKSMMDYIDFRFLQNSVTPSIQGQLQELHSALSKRYFNA